MQLKISTFFKCPSASASASASLASDDDDDLSTWENKRHRILNTYRRTRRNPNTNTNTNTVAASTSKPEQTVTGKTVVKNKKRSYAQFHLDFGQSDFLLRACSTCGVEFTPGNEEDEKAHKEFHKRYTQGIQFRGWTNERVIPVPSVKGGGRIVLVLGTDPSSHRNKVEEVVKMIEIDLGSGWIVHEHCKVYLFVSLQRIVGCLVAEPIKEAFKVVSCSIAEHSDSARKKEMKLCSTTLQFGNIVFQREVEKRAVSVSDSEVMDGSVGGAIFCESKPIAAVCGIRAIWVTPSNRRKRIASQLLDAVRKSFCTGFELEHAQLAFSQPTSAGKALAFSYTGTGSFLVYKAVESGSRNSGGIGEPHVIKAGNLVMTIQVLRNVSKNFSPENELGRDVFGVVYMGELDDGTKIAVKRMEAGAISSKALDEFQAEIAVLSKVRHQHLVSLLGYSIEGNERILVYEFMPQGALSKHLFHWKSFALKPLSWKRRLNIALDVARGMEYLHTLAHQSFIHGDLRSSNILLSEDFRAKVSDFGLVKLAPEGEKSVMSWHAGTLGYLAPEYAVTGKITTKADVFSFGVVLMELLTGLMALDEDRPEESQHLAAWFWHIKSDKKKLMAAIDPVLDIKEETIGSISIIAKLAGHCTAREPSQRPDMNHAVNILAPLVEK